jgi:transcriptional regulator with XRE-family HTH domain
MTDTLGAKIRRARERANLTQFDLAVAIGVMPLTISRWERGLAEPYLKHFHRLVEALPELADDAFRVSTSSEA